MKQREKHAKPDECTRQPVVAPRCAATFPIVALGASAGGMEGFQQFFRRMPMDSGFAFILLQRLDLADQSFLAEVLQRTTSIPIEVPEDRVVLEPNRIFIVRPKVLAAVRDGCLCITPSATLKSARNTTPIDFLFRTLAQDQNENVTAVLLSGMGADGTLGLRAVKEHGGLTLAQSVETAKYGSMPRNAITTGVVDFVLPPEEMPAKIIEYVRHIKAHRLDGAQGLQEQIARHLPKIFPILHRRAGHDFSRYKQSTLVRRIQRRMQLGYITSVSAYLERLRRDPKESENLFRDLLIGVTQFFRDPGAFEALAQQVIPTILKSKPPGAPLRVWVPGCASGEEAYSLAILFSECLAKLRASARPSVQIFGTDIDAEALQAAKKGRYSESIADEMSQERLERFFTRRGSSYEVVEQIREMCLFSMHNVIADPPFSRLELISCRNLLIYLESELQKRLLSVFHFALAPSGFLLLGPSENVASRSELFRIYDKKNRMFQRKPALLRSPSALPLIDVTRLKATVPSPIEVTPNKDHNIGRAIERILLEEYAPAGIIINEQGEAVYFCGRIGPYLEPSSGAPNHRITSLIKKDLRVELRAALNKATTTHEEVVRENIPVKSGRQMTQITLSIRPLPELGKEAGLFIVVFQQTDRPAQPAKRQRGRAPRAERDDYPLVQQLENELRSTKDDLQSTIEELETANEELKSANEELLSMNEELQSTNEELQTSKEELHSVNEELHGKVEELDSAHSDLQNLFKSTQTATAFLDTELRLRKFTPAIAQIAPVYETDVGRPFLEVVPELAREGIKSDLEAVLHTQTARERQVSFGNGRVWCIIRVIPYRNVENVHDGLVITFSDVTEIKHAEQKFQAASREMLRMLDRIHDAFSAYDSEWRITYLNKRAREILTRLVPHPQELVGKVLWEEFPDLVGTQAEVEYRRAVEEQVPATFELFYPPLDSWFEVRAYPGPDGLSVYSQEITERKRVQEEQADRSRLNALRADISTALATEEAEQVVLQQCCERMVRHLDMAFARIWLANPEGSELRLVGSAGLHHTDLDGPDSAIKVGESEIGRIAKTGQPHFTNAVGQDPHVANPEWAGREQIVAFAGYPMILDGKVCGVVAGYSRKVISEIVLAELAPIANGIAQWIQRRRAERALVENEQRFRSLSVCSPVGIFMTDTLGACLYTNPRCQAICGFSFEQALGAGWREFVHPDDRQQAFQRWSDSARQGLELSMEFRFQSPNTGVRWTHVRTSPLISDEKQILGHVGTVEDITDRKEAEEALRNSHQEIQNILNRITDGFIALDSCWRITFVNQTAEALISRIGKDPTLLIGKKLWDEFPHLRGTPLEANLQGAMARQAPVNFERHNEQLDVWFDVRVYPSRDGLSIFFQDVTERKRAQEALRKSEERYRHVIETANEGVCMVDAEFRMTFVNARMTELVGWSSEELVGRKVTEFLFEEDLPLVQKKIAERREGRRDQYDIRLRRKNGGYLWVILCISPIIEGGRFIGALGMLTDISERKRAEQELERQVNERTASLRETVQSLEGVCYTMAHDLRGPLRAIQGFTKILFDERLDGFDAESKEYADRIISAAVRMDALIRDLLEYAKISHAEIPIGPLNLTQEVQRILSEIGHDIESRQAEVIVHPLPTVLANATLMRQILLNLLGNALKFVDSGIRPRIEVRAECSGQNARVLIQDNGIGIAPEHHERIFGLFQRLHTNAAFPGTGIGLAIVRKGMERLGGSVTLRSELGKGSSFILEIPLA